MSARFTIARPRLAAPAPRLQAPPSEGGGNAPFYRSAAWRSFVGEIKRERGSQCEDCGATAGRIHGDHIRELKDGGARFDRTNIRLRCTACSNKKTAIERRKRGVWG